MANVRITAPVSYIERTICARSARSGHGGVNERGTLTQLVGQTSSEMAAAALRDFYPAYDPFGSMATEAVQAMRPCMSASSRKMG